MQEPILARLLFALELTAVGMTVVFLSLLFLQFFINVIGWVERVLICRNVPAAEAPVPVPAGSRLAVEVAPDTVAVISAAVTEVLGESAKIHHIQMLENEEQAGWGRVGRLDIMRSHNTGGSKR